MNLYLGGQSNFGNRGCEALVRGIAHLIHERAPEATLLCPLQDVSLDARQWPNAEHLRVRFVRSHPFPRSMLWWGRLNRVLPLDRTGLPGFRIDAQVHQDLLESSALIMTGGDNLTLDYGTTSLYFWCRFNEHAMNLGLPAVLWGASIGPFSAHPAVEAVMARHLRRYAAITVRETVTLEYLEGLGIHHAVLVADPAFHLAPDGFDCTDLTFGGSRDLLGFNISPLIRMFRQDNADAARMDRSIEEFLRDVATKTDLSVILIPHVTPLDGSTDNSDWHYMRSILDRLADLHDRICLAPPTLNAGQLKFLIGHCHFFIGARTHSTIAALSQGVPTLSIAYSTKAKGLNKDVFGHTRYILDTPQVSRQTLLDGLALLKRDEGEIRNVLRSQLPMWRTRAGQAADILINLVKKKATASPKRTQVAP